MQPSAMADTSRDPSFLRPIMTVAVRSQTLGEMVN
jgi:hypothetical protein